MMKYNLRSPTSVQLHNIDVHLHVFDGMEWDGMGLELDFSLTSLMRPSSVALKNIPYNESWPSFRNFLESSCSRTEQGLSTWTFSVSSRRSSSALSQDFSCQQV